MHKAAERSVVEHMTDMEQYSATAMQAQQQYNSALEQALTSWDQARHVEKQLHVLDGQHRKVLALHKQLEDNMGPGLIAEQSNQKQRDCTAFHLGVDDGWLPPPDMNDGSGVRIAVVPSPTVRLPSTSERPENTLLAPSCDLGGTKPEETGLEEDSQEAPPPSLEQFASVSPVSSPRPVDDPQTSSFIVIEERPLPGASEGRLLPEAAHGPGAVSASEPANYVKGMDQEGSELDSSPDEQFPQSMSSCEAAHPPSGMTDVFSEGWSRMHIDEAPSDQPHRFEIASGSASASLPAALPVTAVIGTLHIAAVPTLPEMNEQDGEGPSSKDATLATDLVI